MYTIEFTEHFKIIDAMKAVFREDARCVALILGGSYGRGDIDVYSDIDCWVLTDNQQSLESLLADMPSIIFRIGAPVFFVTQADLPGFGVVMFRAIFNTMVLCDMHFDTVANFRSCPPRNQNVVAFNKSDSYKEKSDLNDHPSQNIAAEFDNVLGWFVFDSSLVFRRLMKGVW